MNLEPRDFAHAVAAIQKNKQVNRTRRQGDAAWWCKIGKAPQIAGTTEKAFAWAVVFTGRGRGETAVILEEPASICIGPTFGSPSTD